MKALVTGGGGFLGSKICEMLQARGDEVVAFGRRCYPHLDEKGILAIQGDLRDARAVAEACSGRDAVFHAGAIPGFWGKRKLFWETNVDGTRHVVEACRRHGVRKLIFTSSPSVVFGKDDVCGADESLSYAEQYLTHYPETKAVAEQIVLEANGMALATVAVRPHLIWGPGDPHMVPRIVDRARRGKLVQVGEGKNLVDIIYIDNAAEGHLLAADALESQAPCAGRAYFITQDEPIALWPWINNLLGRLNVPQVTKSISYPAAYRAGVLMEALYGLVGARQEPRMTRFLAMILAKSHYFDISAAKTDLGYRPRVSTAEGLERLVASLERVGGPA